MTVVETCLAGLAGVRGNFGQPDGSFDRLDLTEKWADAGKFMAAPMLQQPGGFGCDLPTVWIGQAAPLIHLLPQMIDDGRGVILLRLGGKPLAFIKNNLFLLRFR